MDLADSWPLPELSEVRDRLLVAYGDPARGYHDRTHLAEVLEHVQELRHELAGEGDLDTVLLAAWFHDAVYDRAGEDEERSARLAEDELAGTSYAGEVARLVRLTQGHLPADGDRSGQVLCDADLAILAAEEDRYAAYVAGVRQEHGHLDDDTFRRGRAAVLHDLLAKPTLFHTPTARRAWEERARANVERELRRLDGT
jgi:predicted metal-dependent HD superfamily phosphohydrolase